MSTHDALPPTYRVLGVKKEWQPEGLEAFFASQDCDVHANVGSLALEPNRRTKTATVTFEGNKLPPARYLRSEKLVVEKAFHGVTPLFTPSEDDHKIDVIALSGLGGHAFGSFKEIGGENMWLRDSLPEICSRLQDGGSFQDIEGLATSFRESLKDFRLSKPVILLGNSLGGLIIKETMIQLSGSKISADLSLLRAIYGIVFFAVPHNGMDITSFIPMTGKNNRKWIISDPDFQHWQDPKKTREHLGVLWIKGKPGAGKSTLMKVIYSHLLGQVQHDPSALVASFFFSARGTELERTILGMYRSLLYQLMSRFPDLQAHSDNPKILRPTPSECSLVNIQDLLREAVYSLNARALACVIDALDECNQEEILEMISYFTQLANGAIKRRISLRVCFSSRHYPTIRIRRSVQCILENKPNHARDLNSYAEDNLLVENPKILQMILTKASGVFLWVVLAIRILNKEELEGGMSLETKLAQIPDSLSDHFGEIIEKIIVDELSMETLLLSLQWILYASQNFSPKWCYHGMWSGLLLKGLVDNQAPDTASPDAYEKVVRYVTSSSKGLAEVVGNRQVQFIHESVRGFLINDGGLARIWPEVGPVPSLSSHERLKNFCYAYWKLFVKDDLKVSTAITRDVAKYPLLRYISERMFHHADTAADGISQEEFLVAFPMAPFIQTYELFYGKTFHEQPDLLSWLAFSGDRNLISTVLECIPNVIDHAKRRGWYRYPVLIALAQGHVEAFQVLRSTISPIYTGADLLAENMIDPPARLSLDVHLHDLTPLTWTAWEGYEDIVQSLIHKGEDPQEKDYLGKTPFQMAVKDGQQATITLLLDAGVSGNLAGAFYYTLKEGESNPWKEGYEDLAKLLIERGADVNRYNALEAACIINCKATTAARRRCQCFE